MKLIDEFKKLRKDLVYDMYERIVYDAKDYDDISRTKMLNEILREYKQDGFLLEMCTGKEMAFLKKYSNKKINAQDIDKYRWEIKELNRKCVFSDVVYDVFEEQRDNVRAAIKVYDKYGKTVFDDIFTTMVGIVKVNGELLDKAFVSLISSITSKNEEDINKVMGVPIFHFYCGYSDTYVPSLDRYENTVYYRDYEYLLEDLEYARREFGVGGSYEINMDMYRNIFYYDLDISLKNSKKLYDFINNPMALGIYKSVVEEARVLNNYVGVELFVKDDKTRKLFYDALGENPCAAMNGCTPNQREKLIEEKEDLKYKYSSIPQNNAHLCKNAADEYYKLYFALLEYVNDKFKIVESLKKIYRQEGLNPEEINKINEYLFEHRDIIDEFVKENKYDFNEEELNIINGFKDAVVEEFFIVVKFDREYTEFLSESGKLYMVKGVRADFDEIIDKNELPKVIGTTLLPFKGNIIFNGLFTSLQVSMENSILREVDRNYDKAIKYYHL